MRTLVTGGVRCGKSAHAEELLAGHREVTYLATGPQRDDADWAARVRAHQQRRPGSWRTVETSDAADALRVAEGPVLLDCVGTWLTAQLDELAAWDAPETAWVPELDRRVEDLVAAWSTSDGVAVTNEVGWGVVPEHRSGRIFADRLGLTNQRLAAASDRVVLVVAGQPLVVRDRGRAWQATPPR
ncbi:bifunctional adenosylcobinamide kinase/adenosylcobinamide-phosphate guanylyltransferase [Janibacter alkaliphilus]|uniref:Adenosylcobinamide kinase n=1 Tax=Janibacter alkaliphilus TaxID=1069963 RepID=A0A852X813_9MICO|nr:adenosylcobinamide kinase/adenosylcobinamide-phosphate guanylyltransferase [Janibacter alkaliphilus]